MKLTDKIDPKIQDVLLKLADSGFEVYYVGGLVRNFVMNNHSNYDDVDVSSSATPSELIKFAQDNHIHYLTVGEAHGTITFIIDKKTIEITTFRKDIHTDGRHAIVEFCNDVSFDAQRRDFSVNALYADLKGNIFSPIESALLHADQKEIIFIGSPTDRIKEDVLRILRYYRFSSLIKMPTNVHDISQLIQSLLPSLKVTSVERNRIELIKLLTGKYAFDILEIMKNYKIFHFFFGINELDIQKLAEFNKEFPENPFAFKLYILTKSKIISCPEKFNLMRQESREISSIDKLSKLLISEPHDDYDLLNLRYEYKDDFLQKILWLIKPEKDYSYLFEKSLPEFPLSFLELKAENIPDKMLKDEYKKRRIEFLRNNISI